MPHLYRKKPVVVEAAFIKPGNIEKVAEWCGAVLVRNELDHGNIEAEDEVYLLIETLEGNMRASIGDFVIRGVQGEFYPCKPDIFEQTYERID